MAQSNNTISCEEVVSFMWRCPTVNHQFAQLYRDGELDSCTNMFGNVANCLRAKSMTDPEKAKAYFDAHVKLPQEAPPSTTQPIWKLKEKPGWE